MGSPDDTGGLGRVGQRCLRYPVTCLSWEKLPQLLWRPYEPHPRQTRFADGHEPDPKIGGGTGLAGLIWHSDVEFSLSGTNFYASSFNTEGVRSTPDRFYLAKPRRMIEGYVDLIEAHAPQTIVELGIFQGGSTAFLTHLARPEKLVALDLRPTRVEALDLFLEEHDARGSVRAHY